MIPIEINVTAFHMVVVFGNLLDNALYAANRLDENNKETKFIMNIKNNSNKLKQPKLRIIKSNNLDVNISSSTWYDYWYVDTYAVKIDLSKTTTVAAIARYIGDSIDVITVMAIAATILQERISDNDIR